MLQPEDLSNHAPRLRLKWDPAERGISGKDIEKLLWDGTPRIALAGSTPGSLTIMPYMMMPDDHKIAADAIHTLLSKPPGIDAPRTPSGEAVLVNGQWNVRIEFSLGSADHVVVFEQRGVDLAGTHSSATLKGDLKGAVQADEIHFRSSHRYQGTAINYEFIGAARDGALSGTVVMGEYGQARWIATRHRYV